MAKRIIVIGSGAAGMSAASAAREASPDADITVFTEDEDIAYSPCAIPWGIEGRSQWDEIVMHTPQFYSEKRNIRVLTKTKVESVDGEAKTVTAGGESYPYDSLVIATGGRVFVPPIAGTDLKNVFVVRTVMDGKDIQAALSDVDRVVIGGAGVIGLELAVSLREMGKDVTVIEMMDQVIPRIADKDMADEIQAHLEEKGIRFVMKAPIQAVNGDGRVESVTAAGQEYPCGLMIFATGVRANLDIAKSLGLDVGQLGALVASPTLNAYRRGRLVPDVFVAGDVMQCESAVMPGATMSQLGSTAVRQGRVAGHNAAGGDKMLFGPVASPWVSVIGDKQIAGTGLSLGLASWYGIDTVTGKAEGLTRARYYPGGMELKDAVTTVRKRGILMEQAVPAGKGSMAAVMGMETEKIEEVLADIADVSIANYNCPGQIVITGLAEAVAEASEKLKAAGGRRVIPLNVSGPFHSAMLATAGKELGKVLEGVTLHELKIPYVTNVTAEYVEDPAETKALLEKQISSSVRWQQSVENMIRQGVDTFIEIGPGRTLAGFMRKIDRNVKVYNIQTVEDAEKVCQELV